MNTIRSFFFGAKGEYRQVLSGNHKTKSAALFRLLTQTIDNFYYHLKWFKTNENDVRTTENYIKSCRKQQKFSLPLKTTPKLHKTKPKPLRKVTEHLFFSVCRLSINICISSNTAIIFFNLYKIRIAMFGCHVNFQGFSRS